MSVRQISVFLRNVEIKRKNLIFSDDADMHLICQICKRNGTERKKKRKEKWGIGPKRKWRKKLHEEERKKQ